MDDLGKLRTTPRRVTVLWGRATERGDQLLQRWFYKYGSDVDAGAALAGFELYARGGAAEIRGGVPRRL